MSKSIMLKHLAFIVFQSVIVVQSETFQRSPIPEVTRHGNSVRSNDIPDFIGFSYSRAAQNSPSSRFISFMQENLNINANFIPAYGSFKATQPGVYQFSFSFLTRETEAAIVSLKVNQRIVISGLSEQGAHNPVSQVVIHQIQAGDVVQLEVMQGKVYESVRPEFAYTTFSGWLIAPVDPQFRRRSYDDQSLRCCCEVCDIVDIPRIPPPSYQPPQIPPPVARPPFILTTKPPYLPGYNPPINHGPSPPVARVPDNCCETIIVGQGNPVSKPIQFEKFGVYNVQDVSPHSGRAIFKHCDRNEFVYYFQSPQGWSGWMVGPVVGTERGGLIIESDALCVEQERPGGWSFFDGREFRSDPRLTVQCFNGRTNDAPRSFDGHKIPAYKINSNPDYTEATFVFPTNGSRPFYSVGSGGGSLPDYFSPLKTEHGRDNLDGLAAVVEAKIGVTQNGANDGILREGVVVKRESNLEPQGDQENSDDRKL
ncbi:uncharacterized protein LOC131888061 [Tigriopus californicus]|uniref:uncharacterized protein LOC131888061 n=1 Tax=Tigriopus californicus TaxID=6832 RepID=UPI0027D9DA45|nr:uncharacterized protein LOC131888061 [Tigriopus californicus]